MIEVNDNSFEAEVLKSDIPVLVDFWAPWCGPCKALAPVLEQVAAAYDGKVKLVKVNVDEGTLSQTFKIRGVPTLISFKNGQPTNSTTGFKPKAQVEALFESIANGE